jgi:hypothetical protein
LTLRYIVSGLSVESDIALPGLLATRVTGQPQVSILSGVVPPSLAAPEAVGPNWALAGERLLLAVPGIVRMLLTAGREILYELAAGMTAGDAAAFLTGTGFGLLLHQRGRIVLHASAIRVGDGAVLFCGPSGAGKSTLAAALVEAGCDLVADDVCGIEIGPDGTALVHPDGRHLKLWNQAIERLSLAERRTTAVRARLHKYHVEPRASSTQALPIVAVYVLREARPPHAVGIERAGLTAAAALIRANAYRPMMVDRLGQADLYFRGAVAVARQAGVFHLTRALKFSEMTVVIGRLDAHWRKLGLVERVE